MTTIRTFLLTALATAVLGFAIGRLVCPLVAPATERATAVSSTPAPAAAANPALPSMEFKDQAGFDARVAELEKQGLSESLAKWLVLSAKVRSDLPGSLAVARQARLMREWASAVAMFDPEHGFDLVQSARQGDVLGSMGQVGTVGSFFQTLGRTNPALGLKLLRSCSPGMETGNLAAAFFGSWARIDPSAAMDAASQLQPLGMRELALGGLFREWGRRDRHEMMKWAADQGTKMAQLAFRSQFNLGARVDPVELIGLAREFPEAVDRMVLINVAGDLSARGAKGWSTIADFPKGQDRDGMISWFASRLAEVDPKGAWELARTLSPEDQQQFLGWTVRRRLAEVAPAEIAQFALTAKDADIGDVSEVIGVWGGKDPRAAFEWSQQNLSGTKLANSLDAALRGWGKTDPAAAAVVLNGLSPAMRARLLPEMLDGWVQSDPRAALDYAQKLPAIDRQRAAGEVIEDWAFNDPAAAAKILADQPAAGMGRAYDSVAWRLVDKDPAQAMNWATGIADPEMSARAAGKVMEEWAKKDAASASARVAGLKPGAVRDQAAAGLVESLGGIDPESAADWASSIAKADLRRDNLRKALESWKAKDAAAAAAFARKLQPQTLQDEMLNLVNAK